MFVLKKPWFVYRVPYLKYVKATLRQNVLLPGQFLQYCLINIFLKLWSCCPTRRVIGLLSPPPQKCQIHRAKLYITAESFRRDKIWASRWEATQENAAC